MLPRLALLHLRWFCLFTFVAVLAVGFGHLQDGNSRIFATSAFYTGLLPVILVCLILSVLVPWVMFMIDPRRTAEPTIENFLRHWKAL